MHCFYQDILSKKGNYGLHFYNMRAACTDLYIWNRMQDSGCYFARCSYSGREQYQNKKERSHHLQRYLNRLCRHRLLHRQSDYCFAIRFGQRIDNHLQDGGPYTFFACLYRLGKRLFHTSHCMLYYIPATGKEKRMLKFE